MIAHFDDVRGDDRTTAVQQALAVEPLASIAGQTISSFAAVSNTLNSVGELAIEHGMGQPLAEYQSLLVTYQALAAMQAALAAHAEEILSIAQHTAETNGRS